MIIIELEGGLVQSVKRVQAPYGDDRVALVVDRDFDGVDKKDVSYDREGEEFVGTWFEVERCRVTEGKWWMKWLLS